MKKELLAYLACPHCQSNLKLVEVSETSTNQSGSEEIVTATLECHSKHSFPVVRGVPRMVASELSGMTDMHTGAKFSESWEQFSRFHNDYIRQFFDWLSPISSDFVHDKIVLDAGCGKGRHARVVAECGARTIIAVDIGASVDVAYRNLRAFDNVHVVQGDIKVLPVKPVMDFVYSTGVLHHMDNPSLGFQSLFQKINHDGALAVWVYGKENNWWIISIVNPLRLMITSRMPRKMLRFVSKSLATVVHFLSRKVYKPWHDLRSRKTFLPSLFYESYLSYISRFDFEEIDHIVYDHLVAPVAYYLSRDEVKAWGEGRDVCYKNLRWHNQNSWTLVLSRNPLDGDRIRAGRAGESVSGIEKRNADSRIEEREPAFRR